MNIINKFHQYRIESRFKRKNLAIIQNISDELVHSILSSYASEGWELARQYDSIRALDIHHRCEIRRGQSTLEFALNKDATGNIIGPRRIILALAKDYSLEAQSTPQW